MRKRLLLALVLVQSIVLGAGLMASANSGDPVPLMVCSGSGIDTEARKSCCKRIAIWNCAPENNECLALTYLTCVQAPQT